MKVLVNKKARNQSMGSKGVWLGVIGLLMGQTMGGSVMAQDHVDEYAHGSLIMVEEGENEFGDEVLDESELSRTTALVKYVPLARFTSLIDLGLSTMKLHLHNDRGAQESYVEVVGQRSAFSVPVVRVDLDCGTFCPDVGDANFYLRNVNLINAQVAWKTTAFEFKFGFEDDDREIKGYHNRLGDDFIPDFQVNQAQLKTNSVFRLTPTGELTMQFYAPVLNANIQSTGGCSIAGIDLCNKIFGSDRKIQKGVENAGITVLNGPLVQSNLKNAIRRILQISGITGRISRVSISGDLVRLEIAP